MTCTSITLPTLTGHTGLTPAQGPHLRAKTVESKYYVVPDRSTGRRRPIPWGLYERQVMPNH